MVYNKEQKIQRLQTRGKISIQIEVSKKKKFKQMQSIPFSAEGQTKQIMNQSTQTKNKKGN